MESEEGDDIFQSLPVFAPDNALYQLYQYKGFWTTKTRLLEILAVHNQFVPLPTDVLLTSYPKSGSNWLKSLIFSIINRSTSKASLLSTHPSHLVPNLEIKVYRGGKLFMRRIFSTHIPYHLLPPSMKDSNCKIIYIARNPKDVIVSLWHFLGSNKSLPPITLEELVDGMCTGVFNHGPYFDHVLGYWKERLSDGSCSRRVFFLTYEELKRDTVDHVRRLGEFLGCPFDGDEEVGEIVRMCSFEHLSNVEANQSEEKIPYGTFTYKSFFRKGEVGDYKNWLTPEMIERIDRVAEEKLRGSGLSLLG
ncbi:Cytosolic sulfotransferase 8 [Acorus gramineus]|uniref:Sulfotransferase n=1 Tax=Acorus gramineus TaxID=55184 RepID=A0AAV9B9S8_ACOGR|nr:Cytosolic sulfotransferase 8 [Acorus gramineus]KAK1274604.1 Cytosolic sulfotransferase 8 [Acorus gramineus]